MPDLKYSVLVSCLVYIDQLLF